MRFESIDLTAVTDDEVLDLCNQFETRLKEHMAGGPEFPDWRGIGDRLYAECRRRQILQGGNGPSVAARDAARDVREFPPIRPREADLGGWTKCTNGHVTYAFKDGSINCKICEAATP